MREIKFRGWCPHNKEMYTDDNSPEYTFNVNQGTVSLIPNNGFDDLNSFYSGIVDNLENGFLNIIPMQFTELKDKNGIDIYENDIIKAFDKKYDDYPCNNTVSFIDGCWKASCSWKLDIPLFNYKSTEIEIIGNIYQNPELHNQ